MPDRVDRMVRGAVHLREDTRELLESVFKPAGSAVDGDLVIQFLVLALAVVVAGLSIAISWVRAWRRSAPAWGPPS